MSRSTRIVYLAGPLGFTEAGRFFLDGRCIPDLQHAGFAILNPWSLTDPAVIDQARGLSVGPARTEAWRRANHLVGENNVHAIQSCDAILAFLDGPDVDSGTAAEIGFGYGLQKPIVGYRSDFRLSSDNEACIINLQVQHFIELSKGQIVSTWSSVIPLLNRVLQHA